jgi:hypothetical protein
MKIDRLIGAGARLRMRCIDRGIYATTDARRPGRERSLVE